jgi:hypothetical protein
VQGAWLQQKAGGIRQKPKPINDRERPTPIADPDDVLAEADAQRVIALLGEQAANEAERSQSSPATQSVSDRSPPTATF